jgi:MscS family membrane protein
MKFWEDLLSLLKHFFIYESLIRIIGAIGIIIISLAVRQLFAKVLVKFLRKLTGKTKTQLDDRLLDVIETPARFVFVVAGIWLAVKVLKLPEDAEGLMTRIVRSLVLFSVFWAVYRGTDTLTAFLKKVTDKTETQLDDMLLPFMRNGLKVIVIVIGAVTIVQEWYANIAGLLTGLGLGGLAFALAAQDTAANLFGGITIMMDRPFAVGDWIETPHVEGTVEDIGFRSTKVRTFAQALVNVPNSVLSKNSITNWSRMGKRRITYRLGITYGTTPEQIRQCVDRIRKMLESHPEVHPQTIFVYFERFGESSLDIFLYFFTKTTKWQEFLGVQEDINLRIMDILDEMGISIAFPLRRIYIEQAEKKKNGE